MHSPIPPAPPNTPPPTSRVRYFLTWLAEADRRFRETQSQIDRFTDRY
jgi:hypothetical protein